MKYLKLVIAVEDDYQERLISEMDLMGFDAFEQRDDEIITYIPREQFNDVDRQHIENLLAAYPGEGYLISEEVVADQNWNRQWEQTIQPQNIGPFFVKPTWSQKQPPGEAILLEIDPKMSFGTGYHETTRLMLRALPDIVKPGDRILDAGTGTGILAVAAIKLGAEHVFAFDVDEWSIENATENLLINGVADRVTVKKGSEEVIPEKRRYDRILANINRNTIIKLMPSFAEHLKPEGDLLLSGLLETDRKSVLEDSALSGFDPVNITKENEWIAIHCRKLS